MSNDEGLQVTRHEDLVVVHLPTQLGEQLEIQEYFDSLTSFIKSEQPLKLLVSFEHIKFFGSGAIRGLMLAQTTMFDYGGRLKLCGMSKNVRHLFKLCFPKDEVFEIHDSSRAAADAFA